MCYALWLNQIPVLQKLDMLQFNKIPIVNLLYPVENLNSDNQIYLSKIPLWISSYDKHTLTLLHF